MATIAQIEASIQTLPAQEFFSLVGWMAERHLEMLSADGFESKELEAELLKSLPSPRRPVDDAFFDDVRTAAQTVN